jgi:hypothetical protein
MCGFRSQWFSQQERTDKTDESPFESFVSVIAPRFDDDKGERHARRGCEPISEKAITLKWPTDAAGDSGSDLTDKTDRREHAIPSRCLAPIACGVLGICGRGECIGDEER